MKNSNSSHKTRAGRKPREVGTREKRPAQWLMVCEGKETEQCYFKGFVNYLKSQGKSTVILNLFKTDYSYTNLSSCDVKFLLHRGDSFHELSTG